MHPTSTAETGPLRRRAQSVATYRALHQLADHPLILEDPMTLPTPLSTVSEVSGDPPSSTLQERIVDSPSVIVKGAASILVMVGALRISPMLKLKVSVAGTAHCLAAAPVIG